MTAINVLHTSKGDGTDMTCMLIGATHYFCRQQCTVYNVLVTNKVVIIFLHRGHVLR